jgi:formylglycine-generating enzyme required for sulfatase activity
VVARELTVRQHHVAVSIQRLAAVALVIVGPAASGARAADRAGRVVRVERDAPRDVAVPGGWFAMGVSDSEREQLLDACNAAYPQLAEFAAIPPPNTPPPLCDMYGKELEHMRPRRVFVSAFRIDRDEVSVADYHACILAGACDSDAMTAGDERYITDEGPMVNVTWDEAQAFCHWRGGRLPREAEWERAARGDGNGPWPWGAASRPTDFNHGKPYSKRMRDLSHDGYDAQISTFQGELDDGDGIATLAPPGHYAWGDGPYGTRDMAGNVAEWTADAYAKLKVINNVDWGGYDDLSTVDPERKGAHGDQRVTRGGSWRQPEFIAEVYARDPYLSWESVASFTPVGFPPPPYLPNHRLPYVGFRCVRSQPGH